MTRNDYYFNEWYTSDEMHVASSVAHGMKAGRFDHLAADDKRDLLTIMSRVSERSFRRGFQQGAHFAVDRKLPDRTIERGIHDWRFYPPLDRSPEMMLWGPDHVVERDSIGRLDCECGYDLAAVGFPMFPRQITPDKPEQAAGGVSKASNDEKATCDILEPSRDLLAGDDEDCL